MNEGKGEWYILLIRIQRLQSPKEYDDDDDDDEHWLIFPRSHPNN